MHFYELIKSLPEAGVVNIVIIIVIVFVVVNITIRVNKGHCIIGGMGMVEQLPLPIPQVMDLCKGARMGVTLVMGGTSMIADRQVRAAPDGGKLSDFPPVVQLQMMAVPTLLEVRTDEEH